MPFVSARAEENPGATAAAGGQALALHAPVRFEPRLLTIAEAAERLQVPVRDIKQAIRVGALAHVVIGRHTRIHPEDLDDYCRRHTVKAWSRPAA